MFILFFPRANLRPFCNPMKVSFWKYKTCIYKERTVNMGVVGHSSESQGGGQRLCNWWFWTGLPEQLKTLAPPLLSHLLSNCIFKELNLYFRLKPKKGVVFDWQVTACDRCKCPAHFQRNWEILQKLEGSHDCRIVLQWMQFVFGSN